MNRWWWLSWGGIHKDKQECEWDWALPSVHGEWIEGRAPIAIESQGSSWVNKAFQSATRRWKSHLDQIWLVSVSISSPVCHRKGTLTLCSSQCCYVNIQLNISGTWKHGKEIVKCPGQKGLLTLEPACLIPTMYRDWQVHLVQTPTWFPLTTSKIAHRGPAEITMSLFLL